MQLTRYHVGNAIDWRTNEFIVCIFNSKCNLFAASRKYHVEIHLTCCAIRERYAEAKEYIPANKIIETRSYVYRYRCIYADNSSGPETFAILH